MLYFIIGFIGFVTIATIYLFNSLIANKNEVENAFSGVDVQLKKRFDLIPNIISTVKKFMIHEKELLVFVTELRTKAMNPNLTNDEKVNLDNEVSQALKSINISIENYPDLKSHVLYQELIISLNEVEEQISAARRSYNSAVTSYNNSLEMFPSNLISHAMGLESKNVFKTQEDQKANIDVNKLLAS